VLASSIASSATSAAAPRPSASAPAEPRLLCEKAPQKAGSEIADVKLGHVEATGEDALGASIDGGGGKWTWVNLWAGWCGPCKEEMPLLRAWEKKLGNVRLAFVSIDDDLRMAVRYLDAQPKDGVRRSYHLPDGDDRKEFLEAIGLAEVTNLPVHALYDPQGKLRCVIQGAVMESDFGNLEKFLKR
jgi:thiol-disulfide isomerase/thioredoxin